MASIHKNYTNLHKGKLWHRQQNCSAICWKSNSIKTFKINFLRLKNNNNEAKAAEKAWGRFQWNSCEQAWLDEFEPRIHIKKGSCM